VGPLNVENIRNRENVRRAVLGHLGLAPRLKPRVEPYGSKGMANGNKGAGSDFSPLRICPNRGLRWGEGRRVV
jgi:hypothetical protein